MLSDSPVPVGFSDIEDWILHYTYYHNKEKHTTQSLLQQLGSVLKAESSRLDECNRINGLIGSPAITAEEYAVRRTPVLGAVQRAVETLLMDKRLNGKLDTDAQGVVFFSDLTITRVGTREAIRRARAKEKKANPPRSYESTLREARKRVEEKKSGE